MSSNVEIRQTPPTPLTALAHASNESNPQLIDPSSLAIKSLNFIDDWHHIHLHCRLE
jgi:hypothetical protein